MEDEELDWEVEDAVYVRLESRIEDEMEGMKGSGSSGMK